MALALHLGNAETNERILLIETKGTVAEDLAGALSEMDSLALGTLCTKPLYHAAISPEPPHRLTPAQRLEAVAALEEKLGLTGHARIVVLHEKEGREHLHIVWSRINLGRMTSVSDSHNYRKHEEVARDLERRFGHGFVQGAHVDRKGKRRPERSPTRAELRQEERTGISIRRVREEVTAAFRSSDGPQAFTRALRAKGYILARGDRRDFVIIDQAGGIHSLARRIEGVRIAELRTFMAGLDPETLPNIEEARAMVFRERRAKVRKAFQKTGPSFSKWVSHREPPRATLRRNLLTLFRGYGIRLTSIRSASWRITFRAVGASLSLPLPRIPPVRARRRKKVGEMKAAWRYFLPRRHPMPIPDENEVMKLFPRRTGPMSLYELICFHRANGTLALFLQSMGL